MSAQKQNQIGSCLMPLLEFDYSEIKASVHSFSTELHHQCLGDLLHSGHIISGILVWEAVHFGLELAELLPLKLSFW